MRMKLISLAILVAAAAPAAAQNTASATGCSAREAVGYIGISGIDCNCTIASPGSGKQWVFRTEPKITSLEMDSRAAGFLKVGDVITAVNGKLITTREGAQELADIKPGESVTLTIRRAGAALNYAITAESACPNDTRLFNIYAPGNWAEAPQSPARVGHTPRASVAGELPATPPPPEAATAPGTPRVWSGRGETPPPARAYTVAPAADKPYTFTTPRISFGMGLTCSNCTMAYAQVSPKEWITRFTKPPEVYSIERGGPADKAGIRRGDIITHVDGKPIDSDEGGRIFSSAKPGQSVKFMVVRNNTRKTYIVKAQERTPAASWTYGYTSSAESLERARASLQGIQRAQEEQLRRLQAEVSRSKAMPDDALREAQRAMLRAEQEHRLKLTELSTEMSKAEAHLHAARTDQTRAAACAVPMAAPTAPGAKTSRTLRYTATLGDAEIEVRGSNLVSVSETLDEVVITTGGTVVRVRKNK